MRAATDWQAEAWVLTTDEGRRLLDEVAAVVAPGPAESARWRRWAAPERVAAALRLAEARRRGAAKFARADRMWLDPVGVEQATAEPVARHKARRFGEATVVDLCSGVGGDALALAGAGRVLAVDRDAGMNRRLRWNAEACGVAERVLPVRGRAESFPIPDRAFVHADPDRRARPAGRGRARARAVADYVPGLGVLLGLTRAGRGGAIKLGPASDFEAFSDPDGPEIELISLRGECKEATVWFGALASCRRRATVLPAGATWTDRDGPAGRPAPAPGPDAWLFDPDPALVRAGLLDAFALAHGLGRCAPGVDLLTAPGPVDSPFLAAFEAIEAFPLDRKTLRRVVAERGLGPLEIKPRGLDIRPEVLRAELRPRGPQPSTLLLIGGPGPARAILARRSVDARGKPKTAH